MSLKELAQTVQAQGRGDDTVLVHMTKDEVAGLQALAQAHGGSLTINPETGLPEAGFLSSILPMVAGAAAMFIPGLQGVGLYLMAAGMGAATALATAEDGESAGSAILRGALGGVGGVGLGGLASSALGGAAAGASAGAGAAGTAGAVGAAEAGLSGLGATAAESGLASAAGAELGAAAGTGAAEALAGGATAGTGAAAPVAAGVTEAEALGALLSDGAATPTAGAVTEFAGAVPYTGELSGITAGGDLVAAPGKFGAATANVPTSGYGLTADGLNAGFGEITAAPTTGGLGSGLGQSATSFGDVYAAQLQAGEGGAANYGLTNDAALANPSNWQERAKKGLKIAQQAAKTMGGSGGAAQVAPIPGTPGYNPPGGVGASPLAPGFAARWNASNQTPVPGASQEGVAQRQRRLGYENARWFAEGGAVNMESGGFVVPADVVSALGSGSTDAGLAQLVKLGAEPIKGPGDGQSDDIPAAIDGVPRARVANGEAYMPPEVVARVGGGSHTAGAKRLYQMLDNVRRQAYGTNEQVKPVDIDKALP